MDFKTTESISKPPNQLQILKTCSQAAARASMPAQVQ